MEDELENDKIMVHLKIEEKYFKDNKMEKSRQMQMEERSCQDTFERIKFEILQAGNSFDLR